MDTATLEKPASSAVTVKLDRAERARIAALAGHKNRSAHFLMRQAILEYVEREEARHHFVQAAQASYEQYKQTGEHLTMDEFSAWVDQVQDNPATPMPACQA